MSSPFYDSVAGIFDQLAPVAGVGASYRRGGQVVIASLVVIPGQPRRETATETGAQVAVDETDFIARVADLGAQFPPRPGDEIVTAGGTFRVSRVVGDSCYRYTDPLRANVRIHTKS